MVLKLGQIQPHLLLFLFFSILFVKLLLQIWIIGVDQFGRRHPRRVEHEASQDIVPVGFDGLEEDVLLSLAVPGRRLRRVPEERGQV